MNSQPDAASPHPAGRTADGKVGARRIGTAGLVTGVVVTAGAVAAASFVGYLVGLAVAGIGFAVLIALGLRRLIGSGALRWAVALVAAIIVVGLAVLVPQFLVGRADSRPAWHVSLDVPAESAVLGSRVYIHSRSTDRVIDATTGRTIVSVPALEYKIFIGADGSFVQYGATKLTYRAADGTRRWTIKPRGMNLDVLAIRHGSVVLNRCPGRATVCAVGPDGTITWSSRLNGWIGSVPWERQAASIEEGDWSGVMRVPGILVRNADGGAEIFDAAGNPINDVPGRAFAVGGNHAIVYQGCQVAGYRDGRRTFRTSDLPCGLLGYSTYRLLGDRLYLVSGDDLHRGYAIDIADGSFRRVGRVKTQVDVDWPSDTATPGEDVVVRRMGHRLEGIDPETGRRLWSYTSDGRHLPGIFVEAGAVIVQSDLDERAAALAGLDLGESPSRVAVLNSRSGEVTARRVITGGTLSSAEGLSDIRGLGPGRALLIFNSGEAYALGN